MTRAFNAAGGIYTMMVGASFGVAGTAFNYINQPLAYPLLSVAGFLSVVRQTSFYTSLTGAGLFLGYAAFGQKDKFNLTIDYLKLNLNG